MLTITEINQERQNKSGKRRRLGTILVGSSDKAKNKSIRINLEEKNDRHIQKYIKNRIN